MIAARHLVRTFQVASKSVEVLRDVSLEAKPGERLFLTGASGAGKTTLLYTLAGLERPDSGEVLFGESSIYALGSRARADIRNRQMGFVFQNYHLLPELTALENVLLPAMIRGRAQRDQAAALLEKVGLGHRLQHLPPELSGGEQQRVAIARALINDPGIVFADEPTGNLDAKSGGAVMELLLDVVAESGKTLVVVTHDPDLARLGDRRLSLVDGRLAT